MNKEISAKFVNSEYSRHELENIGFDSSYLSHAVKKNNCKTIKVFNLRPQEASILKQTALSLGFDAAVNRGVLDCSIVSSDALLSGSVVQFEKLAQAINVQPFRMKKVSAEIEKLLRPALSTLKIGNKTFDWSRPYIMGILNVTPDSFSDGGKYNSIESALKQVEKMLKEGADIIDIGAESTRPGHTALTSEEEIKRLKDILKEIRSSFPQAVISVDTRKVETASFALSCGADMINDSGAIENNGVSSEMPAFVNSNNVPYIYTHNNCIDGDLIDSVYTQMVNNLAKITAPVIADVGIGFGKTVEQNYELISRISEFKSLGVPLMVGHSRKSFLSKVFDFTTEELDEATAFVSSKLLQSGVNILRVHDVKRHKLLLNVFSKFSR